MLTLYGRINSINVQKVLWTLGELELAFSRVDAGGAFGGLDTDEYGDKNPNRRVPTLEDEGLVVWESNTIVRYLAARYGAGRLWAADAGARSLADRWMDWQQTTLQADLKVPFMNLVRTPPAERDAAATAAAAERLGKSFALLDHHLGRNPYAAGDAFTMGDIPIGCAYWRYRSLDMARPDLPHCEAWHQRLTERPAFREHVMQPLS